MIVHENSAATLVQEDRPNRAGQKGNPWRVIAEEPRMDGFPLIGAVRPVASRDVKTSPIGLGFEKLDRNVFDPEKAYDKVAALGVKWIRIQSGWARTEKSPGIYDFAWLDDIVDNLVRRGLEPWICLCYGNALYTPAAETVFGAVGVPPIATEPERAAWSRYVAAVTERYRGRVRWYEVWNEPDGLWCWKHGPDGTEYGEFVKATARAVKRGDPEAKVIGGSTCRSQRQYWLNDMFRTGAGEVMDALSYHAYTPDEAEFFDRVAAMRALARLHNPNIRLVQGETGAQSRSDGAGALRGAAWTPARQAKFLARRVMADLLDGVMFSSYFSCLDMIEALKGVVTEKASYLDYAYFGVLAATFDENGHSVGEYAPKPSYRALQTLAAVFREEFVREELPIFAFAEPSPRLLGDGEMGKNLIKGGFRRPDGAAAFVYWKPDDLLGATCEGTVSFMGAALPEPAKLVDLVDGSLYDIPADRIEDAGRGQRTFHHLPLRDYPLALSFGDFILS